jgi:hypothetical protein
MASNDVVATPPEPLTVRYNRKVHTLRLLAIAALCGMCLIIPFAAEGPREQSWLFACVLMAAAFAWAIVTTFRINDRSPQVQVDTNGLFVREWHCGTIPWDNIRFIGHSSQVRRGIIASITRTRRKPYLLFQLAELPEVRPQTAPPLSWFQFLRAEFAIQEPILQQYGLDTSVNEILAAIQAQLDHWQEGKPSEDETDASSHPS